jgi:hypothetical protein
MHMPVSPPSLKLSIVPGTWSWHDTWMRPTAPLGMYLQLHGVDVYEPTGRPFKWSTQVNGMQFWRRLFGWGERDGDHRDWQTGGHNLYAYHVPPMAPERALPVQERNILAHSHGINVVLYACDYGMNINSLITVGSPIRHDMVDVASRARTRIRRWLHVHSDASDRMQQLGEFGDGAIDLERQHVCADINHQLPKAGHSAVLYDPQWFDKVWPMWIDWLRQGDITWTSANSPR